eukprot:282492-Prymnesium_polylepis.1
MATGTRSTSNTTASTTHSALRATATSHRTSSAPSSSMRPLRQGGTQTFVVNSRTRGDELYMVPRRV